MLVNEPLEETDTKSACMRFGTDDDGWQLLVIADDRNMGRLNCE
jgi:hypothetical protein